MENDEKGLVELEELEVLEIDAALLRDLLEEEHEVDEGGVKQLVEVDKDKNKVTDKEEQEEKQQQRWLEQIQNSHVHVHDFEWLNMMEMEMETVSPNDEIVDNWYPDDIVGVGDFGYTNCEYGYSQISDVIVSNETSYGSLWESL
ncbi:hypothetical protein L6164_029313 [Bauhinia variegata]|uniref:Uncharacterized protein n=1 Tax=Bauhinia variegata TaxID=167791 RepID=A0ACB9L940_BAUVA|nr:hypothetical protein L6164_029313 [Bauhinia variegata]